MLLSTSEVLQLCTTHVTNDLSLTIISLLFSYRHFLHLEPQQLVASCALIFPFLSYAQTGIMYDLPYSE